MSQLAIHEVVAELNRRNLVNDAISAVVESKFEFGESGYVRKGALQGAVADALNAGQNNELSRAVINYLEGKGVTTVTIHGKRFFKGVSYKRK